MKKRQARVPFPVLLANVLVLVAVLGLSYMWLCSRCDALGSDIKGKERKLISARKRLVNEQDRWSAVKAPQNIIGAIERHGLAMKMHHSSQIVEVGEWSAAGRTAMNSRREIR